MTVLKGTDLLHAPQLPLQFLDVGKDLGAIVSARFGLSVGETGELVVDDFGFGQGIEETGEEGALLRGHLCRGCVVGDRAVADGPDVLSAVDDEVFVHRETAAGVLLRGDLGHEIFDDGAEGVSGGPDEEAVGEDFFLFGAVGSGVFCFDCLVGDVLDHCFGADGDAFFLEGLLGVVDQLLGEHGKNVG